MANYNDSAVLRIRDVRFILDPDFYLSIPDLASTDSTTATKERGGKYLISYLFFVATYITNGNYFIFEQERKNIRDNSLRIIVLFTPQNCH
jgi:hypothetical protein